MPDDKLASLQQSGHKLTNSRREILELLPSTPATVAEIQEILRQKQVKIDIVTIYRNLDMFIRIGLVRKTQFGDKSARFELITNQDHHHHLICDNCGSVEDIPLDEKTLVNQVGKKSRFKVERHNLEFFGACALCQ